MIARLFHTAGRILFCSLLAAAPALAAEDDAVRNDAIIRIGILTDMTGSMAGAAGKGSVEAAQMAIDDYALKAPQTRAVSLISADYQSRGDLARHISEDWLTKQNVDVVVDVPSATITARLNDLFKEKDRLMLTSCPLSPEQDPCAPTGVSWLYGLDVLTNNLIKALILEQKKNWFIISNDDAYSQTLAQLAQKQIIALGGTVSGEAQLDKRMAGLDMVLSQIRPEKTDIVFLAFDRHDLLHILKHWPEAEENGEKPAPTPIALSGIFAGDLQRLESEDIPQLYALSSFYWDQDPATRSWAQTFAQRNQGAMPSNIHASVYSSVKLYLETVHARGKQSASALLAHMKTAPMEGGPFGTSHIRSDGMVVHRMLLLRSKPPEARATPWDVFSIVRTLSPQELLLPEEGKCGENRD